MNHSEYSIRQLPAPHALVRRATMHTASCGLGKYCDCSYLVSGVRCLRASPAACGELANVVSGSALIDVCCRPAGSEKSVSLISTRGSENWLPGEGTAVTGLSGSLLATVSAVTTNEYNHGGNQLTVGLCVERGDPRDRMIWRTLVHHREMRQVCDFADGVYSVIGKHGVVDKKAMAVGYLRCSARV